MPANAPRLLGSIDAPLALVGAADEPVTATLADMPVFFDGTTRLALAWLAVAGVEAVAVIG